MFRAWNLLGALGLLALSASLALADDQDKAKKGKGKGKGKRPAPEQVFARMDANGDGKVTKEEFTKFHEEAQKRIAERAKGKGKGKSRGKRPGGPEAVARRFDMLDSNKDGSITLPEFKAGMEAARAKAQEFKKKGKKEVEN